VAFPDKRDTGKREALTLFKTRFTVFICAEGFNTQATVYAGELRGEIVVF
jgi:hypothetical protein